MINQNLTRLQLHGLYDVYVVFASYMNKYKDTKQHIVAIEIKDNDDGCPVARATVNVPEFPLEEGHVLIKNYSENAGILPWLIENNIVEDTGKCVPVGYEKVHVCKLLRTS